MKIRPLVIDENSRRNIEAVKAFAAERVLSADELLRIQKNPALAPGNFLARVCMVPMGYRCVFTIEDQPAGRMRHLSVSVQPPETPAVLPSRAAMEMLATAFGFVGNIVQDAYVYVSREVGCIEVMQPLSGTLNLTAPKTAKELDAACVGKKCECCDAPYGPDNPLEFSMRCHPGKPLYLKYWGGVLSAYCGVCEQFVVRVKVAE